VEREVEARPDVFLVSLALDGCVLYRTWQISYVCLRYGGAAVAFPGMHQEWLITFNRTFWEALLLLEQAIRKFRIVAMVMPVLIFRDSNKFSGYQGLCRQGIKRPASEA
jgi:hypothetical protein